MIIFISLSLLSFNNFTWGENCKTIESIYFITTILSIITIYILSIICLIASLCNNNNNSCQCKENFKGLFEYYNYLDPLFNSINNIFCHEGANKCPCILNNNTIYNNITSFSNCESNIINTVVNDYLSNDIKDNIFGKFDINKFMKYFKRIEKKYKCSGWCSYNNSYSSNIKYLFYGLEKGVPEINGCANKAVKDISNKLKIFSIFGIIYGFILIICNILNFCIWKDITYEGPLFPKNIDFDNRDPNWHYHNSDEIHNNKLDDKDIKAEDSNYNYDSNHKNNDTNINNIDNTNPSQVINEKDIKNL